MKDKLLFLKVGLLKAAPPDFIGKLATLYSADVHSRGELKGGVRFPEEILKERGGVSKAIQYEVCQQIAASLQAGRNVVYDSYANTLERRNELRHLATDCGAVAVTMVIHTPDSVREDRIRAPFEDESGQLVDLAGNSDAIAKLMVIGRSMRNNIEWPTSSETAVHLEGGHTTEEMLVAVDTWLAAQELHV